MSLCFIATTEVTPPFGACLDDWFWGLRAGINDDGIKAAGGGCLGFLSSATGGERPDRGDGEVDVGVDCWPSVKYEAGRASRSDGPSFVGRRIKGGGEFA